ncbi:hypothetical protein LMG16407_03659 [Pandoraea apista]|nr:hypothetical protein LMG16407_03659 [Pandoraea apista]
MVKPAGISALEVMSAALVNHAGWQMPAQHRH